MQISEIKQALRSNEWAFELIFPELRNSLIENLADSFGGADFLRTIPTPLLTSTFYKGVPATLRPETGGKKLGIQEIEIIDGDVKQGAEYWQQAISDLLGVNGKLSIIDDSQLQQIRNAVEIIQQKMAGSKAFQFVRHIVVYEGTEWIASSQPHYVGAIFIARCLIGTPVLAENIVHELAHQELFCLNLIDRLIQPEADHRMVYAPFQRTERPPIGRLHAAHALFRICDFLKATKEPSLEKNVACLKKTVETFGQSDLTDFGRFLVNEMERKYA